jgi:hypothetical protein
MEGRLAQEGPLNRGLAMRKLGVLVALAATLALAGVSPLGAAAQQPPPALPPTAHPYGQSYSEWAADWWQWALSQPAATNPLVDATGAQCANEQHGQVWFLAGTITSGPVTRSCTVPAGTALLLPVINAFFCVDPGGVDPGEAALRANVAYVRSATDLTATIDGTTVSNLEAYYEESAIFAVTLPDDNIFDAPGGVYGPCVDAGFYLVVRPLPPGEHTIHFAGTVDGFSVDVTYHIRVAQR